MGCAPDILVVSSGLVNTIDCVGLGPIISITGSRFLPMLANLVLDDVDAIFETFPSYPTGESLFEVKWRTLIANKTAITDKEPLKWYRDLFRKWRDEIREKPIIALTDNDICAIVPDE